MDWNKLAETPEVLILDAEQTEKLKHVVMLSDFVGDQLFKKTEWISSVFEPIVQHYDVFNIIRDIEDENVVKAMLRNYRNQQMVILACHDFWELLPITESLIKLSALAETLIIAARDWCFRQACSQFGDPLDKDSNIQQLYILGMGKLGGRELNYSSDIDLIFSFPEHGMTNGRRSIENQQFFTKMAQRLVNLLDVVTSDGFVYRVDMRLRPYGDSGPLVMSFTGLEDYYQEQGRDWERYAMVKARVLGPIDEDSKYLNDMLRPFVYRRYLDFSAIESLRKMKLLIIHEVHRRQLTGNIKLGAGGIREVEFLVQSYQLIRGGREPSFRTQSLLRALTNLQEQSCITIHEEQVLRKNYLFLRQLENRLQAFDDKQTQTLPGNDLEWTKLGLAFDMEPDELREKIKHTMIEINELFNESFGGMASATVDEQHWSQELWEINNDEDGILLLTEHQIDPSFWQELKNWQKLLSNKTLGTRGRETLDKLMPLLLVELVSQSDPFLSFKRVILVIEKILTRTTYLELLYENQKARQQLVNLCCISPWIAKQLAKFPMLLDELIDPTQLYDTTALDDYGSELQQYLLRINNDDMEQQMEAMRQFKLTQQLKIAAADVSGILPIMKVSDHLTFLAEAIIERITIQAYEQLKQKFGSPVDEGQELGFAIIGYGKLGGIELGYGSDLDLVFVYNNSSSKLTNGERSIDAHHFYLKLAQRILHLFSTRTTSGELYEVDMRLRPQGSSGLMVSEIQSYSKYLLEDAWTWEHQAVIRARFIYGESELAHIFNEIRYKVLRLERDFTILKQEVTSMREKMRQTLKVNDDEFNLKLSPGGITDIEFIGQYLVLAHSFKYKEMANWSDNVRIFETASELEIIKIEHAEFLISTYCNLREELHRMSLQEHNGVVDISTVHDQIINIRNYWSYIFK